LQRHGAAAAIWRLMATARCCARPTSLASATAAAGAAAGARHRSLPSIDTPGVGADRARVLGGDTHVPDKILSIFEPHTVAIRKGKLIKPTEFGNLVTIQEAEGQIVSAYEVHARRPADRTLWVRALGAHQQQFGRAPALATGDRG
jgi:hypothetical protein